MHHPGVDDDVAGPRRGPYAAANNTRDSATEPFKGSTSRVLPKMEMEIGIE